MCIYCNNLYSQANLCGSDSIGAPGVNFLYNVTWSEAQVRAKAENKMIFVDCFATWCGPCKVMEQIFNKKEVADFFECAFCICLRVQNG